MSAGAPVDPHDKMRVRDVNKVVHGEQAPKPAHEFGTVSPPHPPSSIDHIDAKKNKCIKQNGEKVSECEKLGTYFRSSCPTEWIVEWDREKEEGKFPKAI